MDVRTLRARTAIGVAALAALAANPWSAGAQPGMTLLYDLDPAVRELVAPSDGRRALTPDRGAFRQEKSGGHLFRGPADAPFRVAKVNMDQLEGLSARAIASRLRNAITHGCGSFGCRSHLVSVDEAGRSVSDGPVPRGGARGDRLRPIDRSSLGHRFSQAMAMLDVPSPYGGTFARRVHVFIAPAMTTAIAAGRGPNRNLGRDGKAHFTTWRAVMPGLARAGGLWLEMYHGTAGSTTTRSMTAREWRTIVPAFLGLVSRHGGGWRQLHFVFTGTAAGPAGAGRACGPPMTCTWRLASSTPANLRVLANRPGAYRLGAAASRWLDEFNARFP